LVSYFSPYSLSTPISVSTISRPTWWDDNPFKAFDIFVISLEFAGTPKRLPAVGTLKTVTKQSAAIK